MIKLHNRYLNIGLDLNYTDSLTDTILTAIDLGIYTMLFNLGNSRNYTRKRVDMEDLVVSMGLTTRFPIIVFSSIPIMYSLCGSKNFLAWNGNHDQDTKTIHILKEIEYELYTMSKLGGSSIIQLGSYRHKKSGLETVVKSINHMNFKIGYNLVLTNSLDNYFHIGITLQDLKYVYDNINPQKIQYINIGLNVAYLFNNGLYDVRKSEEIQRLFKEYDLLFSNKYTLTFMLLTDSEQDFNSKEYINTSIGNGLIWKDSEDALYTLLEEAQKRNIAILTESLNDMELLRTFGELISTGE
jgi:endonuclease IV